MPSMKQFFHGLSMVVVALAVAVGAVPAQAQIAKYRIVDLGTFGSPGSETYSTAHGINERGDVTGAAHDDDFVTRAFLYRDGTLIDVGAFTPDYYRASGQAVNAQGQVAGRSIGWSPYWKFPTWVQRPFLGTAGVAPFDPGQEVGIDGEAFGINDLGQMAITLTLVPEYQTVSRAHVWDPQTGLHEIVFPSQPAGEATASTAWAINQPGQVAGAFVGPDLVAHAYIWDPQTNEVVDLHGTDASESAVYALNDHGDAAGWWIEDGQSDIMAVVWAEDGRVVSIPATQYPALTTGTAEEINNLGDVVGWYEDPQQTVAPRAWVAFNVLSNQMSRAYRQEPIVLNELLNEADQAEWELWYAHGINDARQIVGYGLHNGIIRGFLMTPRTGPAIDVPSRPELGATPNQATIQR